MTNTKENQKADTNDKKVEGGSGKDRRKALTMIDTDKERRLWNRRKKKPIK